jgi:hypothetical protein
VGVLERIYTSADWIAAEVVDSVSGLARHR